METGFEIRYPPASTEETAMDAKEIFESYFRFVAEQGPTVFADYTQNALWTPRATSALAHVGLKAFPASEVTAKGHAGQNQWGRSEYLNLDVTIGDPKTWGPPAFIAEHENAPSKAQVQYDTWKLLVVEAQRRVLVGYWGDGTQFKNFDEMKAAVLEVCGGQPGKDVLVLGGKYNAKPTNIDEFRAAHETFIAGVHRMS
jgi:hypothetical protein